MLREWLQAFKGDSETITHNILDLFQDMVNNAAWMFSATQKLLTEDDVSIRQEILARDLALNQNERKIRQWIVQHLAIRPEDNLGLSLVVFSGVKDAERLGDYCKNLLEVTQRAPWHDLPENHRALIERAYRIVEPQFPKIGAAFTTSDKASAQDSIETLLPLQNECHDAILAVLEEPREGDIRGATAGVLILRYLKRIADHLCNIATGVTQPVHRIDHYRDDADS